MSGRKISDSLSNKGNISENLQMHYSVPKDPAVQLNNSYFEYNSEPTSTKSSPIISHKWKKDISLDELDESYQSICELSNEIEHRSEISDKLSDDEMDKKYRKSKSDEFKRIIASPKSRNLSKSNDFSNTTSPLPTSIREELISNFKYPLCRTDNSSTSNISYNSFTVIFLGLIFLLFISIVYIQPVRYLFVFTIGFILCFVLLNYLGFICLKSPEKIINLPKLKEIKSPMIPNVMENDMENFTVHSTEDSHFSGWANVINSYNIENYNINNCHTVHIDLEARKRMRLRRPRTKIPRRAVWNEGQYSSSVFISDFVVDLSNIQLELLPKGLVHKRLWSKKYPIHMILPKPIEEYQIESSFFDIFNPKSRDIYIFGRTSRDKEEWFRRILYGSFQEHVDLKMWNIILQHLTKKSPLVTSQSDPSFMKTNSLSKLSQTSISDPFSGVDDISGGTNNKNSGKSSGGVITFNRKESDSNDNNDEDIDDRDLLCIDIGRNDSQKMPQIASYVKYMSKFMPSDMFLLATEVMHLDINYISCADEMLGLNALLGRVFWDFLRGSHWSTFIRNKIQCKLQKIHLPQFIDQLKVVDIHLGKELPLIRKLNRPYLNSRGLWIDAEITYSGGLSMILETKVNLFNLRSQARKSSNSDLGQDPTGDCNNDASNGRVGKGKPSRNTGAYRSDEEDSAESSTNSEQSGDESSTQNSSYTGAANSTNQSGGNSNAGNSNSNNSSGGGGSKRFIRWVDKIAKNPYFIKAADNKYVQRGMEIVSNTKLMLQVEMHSVTGTLALNIPPPPSDRLWFGFRPRPNIELSAKPKVGQKEISFTKVTDFIEKKLLSEFERVLVLPNMDDVALPLLINGHVDDYFNNL